MVRNESNDCERREEDNSNEGERWSRCVANALKFVTLVNGDNGSEWRDNGQCFCPLNLSLVPQPNHIHWESFEALAGEKKPPSAFLSNKREERVGILIYQQGTRI